MRPLPPAARPLVASRRLRLIVTAAAVVLVAATAAAVSWRYLFRFPNEPLVDLRVYQQAGDAVLDADDLVVDREDVFLQKARLVMVMILMIVARMGVGVRSGLHDLVNSGSDSSRKKHQTFSKK